MSVAKAGTEFEQDDVHYFGCECDALFLSIGDEYDGSCQIANGFYTARIVA